MLNGKTFRSGAAFSTFCNGNIGPQWLRVKH